MNVGNTTFYSGQVIPPHSTAPIQTFRGNGQRVGNTTIYRGY
jgi:hypothetical protein